MNKFILFKAVSFLAVVVLLSQPTFASSLAESYFTAQGLSAAGQMIGNLVQEAKNGISVQKQKSQDDQQMVQALCKDKKGYARNWWITALGYSWDIRSSNQTITHQNMQTKGDIQTGSFKCSNGAHGLIHCSKGNAGQTGKSWDCVYAVRN